MMSSGSSSTKKRKASNTHHDVDNSGSSAQSCYGNLSQQMDTMMQIMLRMEEKCNRLEAKCNSLENIVSEQVESLHTKIDGTVKHNEFNSMVLKNQSWKYPTPVHSTEYWMSNGFDRSEAIYLSKMSKDLKEATESLRRGNFPIDEEGICFEPNVGFIVGEAVNNTLFPHWREFAAALKQFTPAFDVLPNGCEKYFRLWNVHLNAETIQLLKEALMNKPFQELRIMYTMGYATMYDHPDGNDRRIMVVEAIIALVQSNKHLHKLDMEGNLIDRNQIGGLCSSVRNHPSLLDLDLSNCFDNGVAFEMMTSLLTNGDIRWERLVMSTNNITSNVTALLSGFLATDPPLKVLYLSENTDLNDDDAALLANALRSNKSLRHLDLYGTSITNVGGESFRLVLNNDSTLNSISDSNHSCWVSLDVRDSWNMNDEHDLNDLDIERQKNRARKIYKLLSSRHKSMSNVQHFGDIDANVLPHMVKAMQTYAEADADYSLTHSLTQCCESLVNCV